MWKRTLLRGVNRAAGALLSKFPGSARRARYEAGPPPWRRILLVKLVGMGDAILIRSLAEYLLRVRPDAEIGVLGGPSTAEVLGVNSGFTVHRYDPEGADQGPLRTWAKAREIRSRGYDAVIDFEQHFVLVALFLRMCGIPHRIGLSSAGHARARFQTHTVPLTGEESMWAAYEALMRVAAPTIDREATTRPLPCSKETASWVDAWWKECGLDPDDAVAMHLGSGSRAAVKRASARRWPVPRFVDLAERLRAEGIAGTIVLTGTRDEAELVEEFTSAYTGRAVDATGLGSIERAAEVLRRCRLVVSNDTGVMHLAAAMGAPTVGLFGPNTPRRYGPIGPRAASVYTTKVPCSPCINVHLGVVPECFHPEKGRCLLDLDVETALSTAKRLLAAGRSPVPASLGGGASGGRVA